MTHVKGKIESSQGVKTKFIYLNRLRLTCDGWILPCLFNDGGYSVRELGASEALLRAAVEKPRSGSRCTTRAMQTIGG